METPDSDSARLVMRNVRKTFGAIKALENVSFTVHGGEVHALMGENGAGKSTLMKVLAGALRPDPGAEIFVDGAPLPFGDPKAARDRGVAVIYQELTLAPNLTVAQNIFLGNEYSKGGIVDRRTQRLRAQEILGRLGISFGPDTPVSSLSLGERQLVEIARAMSLDARIVVMDEPTTSLSTRETEKLFAVIAALKKDGIAIVYISHRMDEIYELSDRCSVLRDGSSVGTLERSELNADRLVSMMVGRDLSSFYRKAYTDGHEARDTVLSVRSMADGERVRDCSFEVRRGEVLGIAGLVGAGRTELLRLIYGADRRTSGQVFLEGKDVTPNSAREALERGIVYLTEDRKELGLFLNMTISDNVNMAVNERDAGGLMRNNAAKAKERSREAISQLAIRTTGPTQGVSALSGGNQQKVLLARLLQANPKVLLLDEPTRGVDIGAKSEIYRLIGELAQGGMAIVMVSSELAEIIGVADRALVMREGRIAGEVRGSRDEPISQEKIMTLTVGGGASALPAGSTRNLGMDGAHGV